MAHPLHPAVHRAPPQPLPPKERSLDSTAAFHNIVHHRFAWLLQRLPIDRHLVVAHEDPFTMNVPFAGRL